METETSEHCAPGPSPPKPHRNRNADTTAGCLPLFTIESGDDGCRYKTSHGLDINAEMACPLLMELLSALENAAAADNRTRTDPRAHGIVIP